MLQSISSSSGESFSLPVPSHSSQSSWKSFRNFSIFAISDCDHTMPSLSHCLTPYASASSLSQRICFSMNVSSGILDTSLFVFARDQTLDVCQSRTDSCCWTIVTRTSDGIKSYLSHLDAMTIDDDFFAVSHQIIRPSAT